MYVYNVEEKYFVSFRLPKQICFTLRFSKAKIFYLLAINYMNKIFRTTTQISSAFFK